MGKSDASCYLDTVYCACIVDNKLTCLEGLSMSYRLCKAYVHDRIRVANTSYKQKSSRNTFCW